MENDDFVNLHLHTMYSIQDAVIKPQDLVNTLKEYGQTRCALTDHSSCASWIDFDKEFRNNNIQPIFGNEFYCNKTCFEFSCFLNYANDNSIIRTKYKKY